MAIALDTTTMPADGTTSWSHTSTGANLLLVVAVYAPNNDLTAISYNGVAMTKDTIASNGGIYVYYKINPPTGANTVAATGPTKMRGVSATYTGVSQSAFPDSEAGGNATTPQTLSTTVVASNCWLLNIAGVTGGTSASTNRTDRQVGGVNNSPFAQGGILFGDSNGIVGTGSQGTTFTAAAGNFFGISVISIAPSVSAPIPINLVFARQAINRSNTY